MIREANRSLMKWNDGEYLLVYIEVVQPYFSYLADSINEYEDKNQCRCFDIGIFY